MRRGQERGRVRRAICNSTIEPAGFGELHIARLTPEPTTPVCIQASVRLTSNAGLTPRRTPRRSNTQTRGAIEELNQIIGLLSEMKDNPDWYHRYGEWQALTEIEIGREADEIAAILSEYGLDERY